MVTKKPKKPRKVFSLLWAFEPFQEEEQFYTKRMFGALAAYLDGRLVLLLAENGENTPWNGILVPTEKSYQETIQSEIKSLRPHEILPKWLYLPMSSPDFESDALKIGQKIYERDVRFGVEPQIKKKTKKTKTKGRK